MGRAVTPAPAASPARPRPRSKPRPALASIAVAKRRPKPKPQPTVFSVLARLAKTGALSQSAEQQYSADYGHALAVEKHLTGTRLAQLDAVTVDDPPDRSSRAADAVAAARRCSRPWPRNRQWWTTGPLLSSGQRVEFAGSQLVWEYYPGQGIQLQVLGSFGKADGLYTAGPADYPAMEQLLAELIPLAAERGGGLAWEYYFNFDGGRPPWTSAMSQATALEALTRAYQATGNPYYLTVARQALPIFTVAPPAGVAVRPRSGRASCSTRSRPGHRSSTRSCRR